MLKFMDDGLPHKTPDLIIAGKMYGHAKNSVEDARKDLLMNGFLEKVWINKKLAYQMTAEGRIQLGNVATSNLMDTITNTPLNQLP